MPFRANSRESFLIKRLPTRARPAEESDALAQKFASRLEWMRERGIGLNLARPLNLRPAKKNPLPGTTLYFSDSGK